MNTPKKHLNSVRGSGFITVIIIIAVMATLTASILSYSISERRINERQKLVLKTRNMAENIANYAAVQLSSILYRIRSSSPIQYSVGSNKIDVPAIGSPLLQTDYGSEGTVAVNAGLTSSTTLTYIDPTLAATAKNTYAGLSVITSIVPVVAKATITHPTLGTYSSYTQQELSVAQIPLYQFAIFYDKDLEFGPGLDMIIDGPVHTNGSLLARCQDNHSNTVQFKERVTVVNNFYAHGTKRGAIYSNDGGSISTPGGDGALKFQDPAGNVTNIRNTSNIWSDQTMSINATGTETSTTMTNFKNFADSKFRGNLRTTVHDVTRLSLPGVDEFASITRKNATRSVIEPPLSTDTAGLVQFKFSRHAGLYIIVNPTGTNPDTHPVAGLDGCRTGIMPNGTTIRMPPYTYLCWLNSIAADGVTHTLTQVVLPGQPSYLDQSVTPNILIKNNLPNRFTNLTAIGSNQILRTPIPYTVPATNFDNPYLTYSTVTTNAGTNLDTTLAAPVKTGYETGIPTTNTAATPTIPSLTGFKDAYFYDLRRADGSNGYGALATSRATTNFNPRPSAKIDFDMTRFKLAVERTYFGYTISSSIFNPDVPNNTNWNYNMLKPSAAKNTYSLGIRNNNSTGYLFPQDSSGAFASDPFKIYMATASTAAPVPLTSTDLINTTQTATPWYDGIAIYIHSAEAENKDVYSVTKLRKRMDSGVRFINGRGLAASLDLTGRTGISFATNDAAYIFGHLNADGTINDTTTSTGTNGYSARYPETNEKLCNIMADSLTVLSQPEYGTSGGFYIHTNGWSDSLSANAISTGSWSASWQTTNPSGSNQYDGITTARFAGRMPNEGSWSSAPTTYPNGPAYGNAPNQTTKFRGADTEISSCLLQGIVQTTSSNFPRGTETDGVTLLLYQTKGYQSSGGVHNFPRMSENWNGDLYIRGSMVAMFESEVACEPWLATRIYSAPGRKWGLHNNLRAENNSTGAHDVPLEPILINVSRRHFAELNPGEYATQKAIITALPTN